MRIFEIPAGSGIQSVLERAQIDRNDPSTYFLLPEIAAISQMEKLFASHGLWGERLLTFGKLAAISNLKSKDRFIEISRMGRLFLIEEVVNELKDNLTYFRQIISIKGFSQSFLRLIAELKHAKVYPKDLIELATRVKENNLNEKLNDIALIFELYQRRLREEGLVDDIDRLKLLSDNMRNGELKTIFPEARTFVVFGFFDFTYSQLDILKSIDDSGYQLLVYIPSFFESTTLKIEFISRLKEYFKDMQIEQLSPSPLLKKKEIEILSFRSFMEEAEFAAREIKKLTLSGEVKPDEITVVARSYSGKQNYVIRAFEKLGIPYSMPGANNLRTSTLGRFVLDLLRIKLSDFERGLFIHFLRSPLLSEYFKGIDSYDELISGLDLESRKRRALGGVREWREILESLTNKEFASSVGGIIDKVDNGFNSNVLEELIEDLGEVIDGLLIYKAVEDLALTSNSYHPAWEKFSRFLGELLFLSRIRFKKSLGGVEDFITLLEDLMSEEGFSSVSESNEGKTQLIGALETIGASFPIVFILDVCEKSFPYPPAKDPIIKNNEREIIASFLGKNSLTVENYHYEAEELLFKLICNSAQRKLYITYSYLDEKERTKLPSYLVSDLIKKEKLEVKKISTWESLSQTENIYTGDDLARYVFYCGAYKKGAIPELLRQKWNPYTWVASGIEAEESRLTPSGTYSNFEGIINRKDLLPSFAEFSPTSLEKYGDCPFKYFAWEILGLDQLEVEDEVSVLDLGIFYHKLLKTYFELIAQEKGGRVDLRDMTDEELLYKLNEVLKACDFDNEFKGLSTGIGELVRIRVFEETLPQFILAEARRIREWNDRGFFPAHFEERLEFNIGDLKINGVVDRVDVGAMGALVIDYKLRSSYGRDFFTYKSLQLPLYLIGFEGKGIRPFGGYYRFVEKPDEVRGKYADGKVDISDLLESSKIQVEMYANLMKEGFFAPVIEKKEPGFEKVEIELRKDDHGSCKWCGFRDLCRVQGGTVRIHES